MLIAEHKELETRTKSGLARTAAVAAEAAATQNGLVAFNRSQNLQQLAAAAARVFGWNTDGPQVQVNTQIRITQEQLEQIRALRGTDPVSYTATRLEGPPRPFPDNPNGPVDFELKISS